MRKQNDTRDRETVRIAAYSQLPGRFLSWYQVLRCAGPLPAQREDDQHDNHDDYDCSDADIHKVPFISTVRLPHCPQRVRPNRHARMRAPARRPRAGPRAVDWKSGFAPVSSDRGRAVQAGRPVNVPVVLQDKRNPGEDP